MLPRTTKEIGRLAGAAGDKLRDRTRAVKYRLLEIGRASRSRAEEGKEKLKQIYQKLLSATARVVAQARRFAHQVAAGIKCGASLTEQAALERVGSTWRR